MLLSGNAIKDAIDRRDIVIEPFNPSQLEKSNPNSYNLRLHKTLLVYTTAKMHHLSQDFGPKMRNEPGFAELTDWDEGLSPGARGGRLNILDMAVEPTTATFDIPDTGAVLFPGRLYLGRTIEYTESPVYVPMLEGRSSVGRLGIEVHISAGFGDRGFRNHWTLEITVVEPVRVYAGVDICQVAFHEVDQSGPIYSGKYQGDRESPPGASALWKEVGPMIADRRARSRKNS